MMRRGRAGAHTWAGAGARRGLALLLGACALAGRAAAQVPGATPPPAVTPAQPPPAAQNPSPMEEHTRAHERLQPRALAGVERTFAGPGGKPVTVFVPASARHLDRLQLYVHFLGAAFVPEQAVSALGGERVLAVVNLGAGSGAFARPFQEEAAFDSLLAGVAREVAVALAARRGGAAAPSGAGDAGAPGPSTGAGAAPPFRGITLSGFSAGYGAIRSILSQPRQRARVDAVLLIDGLHTSYIPDGVPLAKGGVLDTTGLQVFVDWGRAALRGEKRFLVTHSEIFPGTFASTTETTDYLLRALGLRRRPVLRWGPRGMQQLSEARGGRFRLLGFAGNSAPDHIDQLHALPELLRALDALR